MWPVTPGDLITHNQIDGILMKPSDTGDVREMYDETAESYDQMMDQEIDLPVYAHTLGLLQLRLASTPGLLIDTACGSGHMLARYREQYEPDRPLLGIDLSPRMVAIAGTKLGPGARIEIGDMRSLAAVDEGCAAGILNFFAVHHLDPEEAQAALGEWHRVLVSGGQLVLAAWEGAGPVDYGDESDLIALRYGADELNSWAQAAGFTVTRCVVEPVEDFPMDAVYLEAVKE